METAVCVSGFLLLAFITGAYLSPDPEPVFGVRGEIGNFGLMFSSSRLDYCVLYRVYAGAFQLLVNSSQPDFYNYRYSVACNSSFGFSVFRLSMSQSGIYSLEGWRGGNLRQLSSFHLTVCERRNNRFQISSYIGTSFPLCGLAFTLDNSSSIQVYRYNWQFNRYILVLDTKSSLEPLVEDLRGRLQVDLHTSRITLSGVKGQDCCFCCTVWRGARCQHFDDSTIHHYRHVSAHEAENVTLPCVLKGVSVHDATWHTPTGDAWFNMTNQQEMEYRNQTGSYSLTIPTVSQHHSGKYECQWRWHKTLDTEIVPIEAFHLYVCPIVSPLDVMFSHGESVYLNYTPQLNISSVDGIQWYCQRVLEPRVLILDSVLDEIERPVPLPEDLMGQVSWKGRETNSPLIISNLTAEDSGLYTWRVYGKDNSGNWVCSGGSIRLVYRDPFGVHSAFYRAYAPLMGCGLMGLVAAVIWFKLRSRRREQTSGRQSREGQQSGDEDLHEEDG